MAYRYTQEDIRKISGADLVFGESINVHNGKHLPELIRIAERDLNAAKQSEKLDAIQAAQNVFDERTEKLRAYKLAFPNQSF